MVWLVTYIEYFALFLISFLFVYSLGKTAAFAIRKSFPFSSQSPYEEIFIHCFLGLTISVVLFSFLKTNLKTVNLLFLLVGISTLCALKADRTKQLENYSFFPKLRLAQFFELFLYLLFLYSLFAFGTIRRSDWSSLTKVPHLADWTFYSMNMQILLQTGQENFYNVNNLLDSQYRGMAPYHYFEMWIAGIWKTAFPNLLPIYLLAMTAYPLCAGLALVGTWALLDRFLRLQPYHKLFCFLCFFCSGWFFLDARFLQIRESFGVLTSSVNYHFLFLLPKRFISYAAFLASLLLFLSGQKVAALISLLALPTLSVDSFPAVFGGILLLGIVNFKTKWIGFQKIYLTWSLYLAFGLVFFLLYRAFGNHQIPLVAAKSLISESFKPSVASWIIPLLFFVRAILLVVILYSFHIWIGVLLIRQKVSPELNQCLLLICLMLFSGCIGWAVFYLSSESIQFLTGIVAITQTTILVCGLALLSRSGRTVSRVLLCAYLVVSSSYVLRTYFSPDGPVSLPYGSSYLERISKMDPRSEVGISIRSTEGFSLWANRNVVTHSLGDDYLAFMPQYLKAVEVGVFHIPETPFRERLERIPILNIRLNPAAMDVYRSRLLREAGLFYRFYQRMQKKNPGIAEDEAQVVFIDQFRIDWGIVSRDVEIGPKLRQRVIAQEIDPVSGERFMLFKLEHPPSL